MSCWAYHNYWLARSKTKKSKNMLTFLILYPFYCTGWLEICRKHINNWKHSRSSLLMPSHPTLSLKSRNHPVKLWADGVYSNKHLVSTTSILLHFLPFRNYTLFWNMIMHSLQHRESNWKFIRVDLTADWDFTVK